MTSLATTRTTPRRRRRIALAVVAACALASPASAPARTLHVSAAVRGGYLALTTPSPPTLSVGADIAFDVPMLAIDARGSGAGWRATITSTRFSPTASGARTASDATATLRGWTSATCATGSTCTPPRPPDPVRSGSWTIRTGDVTPPGITFQAARARTGLGTYAITGHVRQPTPATVAGAGTYTSTVTVAIVGGP